MSATSNSSSPLDFARSSSNNSSRTQADIDELLAENAFLRLELEETQAKLRAATSSSGSSSAASGSREPRNGGVAYAQLRRLLLKDRRFLRNSFLPFLNIEDFGRLSGVCRRFKKSIYDLDAIVRCVESGGVTEASRGLMWLIMVGMDTVEPASRGVLGVVIRDRRESPEEQYDRLHRAMNGTTAISSPANRSRTASTASGAGENSGGTAVAATAVETAAGAGKGYELGPQVNGGPRGRRFGEIVISDNGDEDDKDRDSLRSGGNSSRADGSRADSRSPAGGGDDGGDASIGGESVVLWEDIDSDIDKEPTEASKRNTSPRMGLRLHAGTTGAVKAVTSATSDQQVMAESAASAAAEAAELAAMAKAAAEAAGAAFDAEAASGIRPLGGRQGLTSTAAATAEAAEAVKAAVEAAEMAAGLAEAAADAEDVNTSAAAAKGEGWARGAIWGGAGPSRQQTPPVMASAPTSSVVGWASGLFRRSPGISSPGGSVTSHASVRGGSSSPGVSRQSSEASLGRRACDTARTAPPAVVTRMSSAGRLFGGLRYPRVTGVTGVTSAPKSTLPADNSSPSSAVANTRLDPFSGEQEEDGDSGAGEVHCERVPGLYPALLMGADAMDANDMTGVRGPKQSSFVDIEKDLQRTLGMTDVKSLRNVLRCTATFVPDVGYVQGMNFVCRSLLQVYKDEEEAFWVFVGMLQRFRLRELYCPGMPLLRLRFFQLNRLLLWHLPDLSSHFAACGVQTKLFATSWFMTLLSNGGMLPDAEVKVVWDSIFLHYASPASQWSPVFLFVLELLRRASDALRQESRFSELIQRLVNIPFRELLRGKGASSTIEEARRRFETSSPMPVQLLLLRDQWVEGGGEEGTFPEDDHDDKQLL